MIPVVKSNAYKQHSNHHIGKGVIDQHFNGVVWLGCKPALEDFVYGKFGWVTTVHILRLYTPVLYNPSNTNGLLLKLSSLSVTLTL